MRKEPDSLAALLSSLDERIARQERHQHPIVGGSGASSDLNNHAKLGSDGLVYANMIVAAYEPPPPREFGGAVIPVGAVWLSLAPLPPPEGGWCDDFERVSLGPDWTAGPLITDVAEQYAPTSIQTGAVISAENVDAADTLQLGSVQTTRSFPGDQTIEIDIGNFFQGHDPDVPEYFQYVEAEHYIFSQIVPGSNECLALWIWLSTGSATSQQEGFCELDLMKINADGSRDWSYDFGIARPLADWRDNPDFTFRFETTVDGHCRGYFNGTLLCEDDLPPVTGGEHAGFAFFWNRTNYGDALIDGTNPGVSTRAEGICVNMPPGTPY